MAAKGITVAKQILEQELARPDDELKIYGLNGNEVKEAAWKLYLTFDRPTVTFDVFARTFKDLFNTHIEDILKDPDYYYKEVFSSIERDSDQLAERDAIAWVKNQGGSWESFKGVPWNQQVKVTLPDGRVELSYNLTTAVEKLEGHRHIWQYWEGDDYVMCTRCAETRPIPEPTTQPA